MHRTIHTAAEEIRQGRLTPVQLLDECLACIDRYEPRVRGWVFVDRDGARADAERLTLEQRRGQYRGPLHGIPLGVKDIIDVFDWPTAAGSQRWAASIARQDATIVRRLRQAGAVFVGKTVTTQFASFDPPPTRNPWNLERTPGGSSSGSAAAVACGMCLGALGSQTGGSITRPAAYCGVAGCKPTYGRVSLDGIVPLAPSMDHPGPIASCVKDLAILLQIIAGPDPRDSTTASRPVPDYLVRTVAASPPHLSWLRGLFEERAEPEVRTLMDQVSKALVERGATIGHRAPPASFADVVACHLTVMAVETAAYHEQRLRHYPDDYGPKITQLLEEGLRCPAPEYARCMTHKRQLTTEMQSCVDDVDALLTPATAGPAPDASTTGDPAFNAPWSYVGFPTVSFPAGWSSDGLPLGLQLVGHPWREAELLAAAAWCEQVLAVPRVEPPS